MNLLLCLLIHKTVNTLEKQDLNHSYDGDVCPPTPVCVIAIGIIQEQMKGNPVNRLRVKCKWIIDKILPVLLLKNCVVKVTHLVTWPFQE